VSTDQDRQFFDTFMLVLGILVAVAFGIYFLAKGMSEKTQMAYIQEDPRVQARVEERIAPQVRVAVAGEDNSDLPAPGAPPAVMAAAAPAPSAAEMTPEAVYNNACAACHAAGVAGAPILGDQEGWSARIAKGMDTLATHAIQGYQGEAGYMPAKGGRSDLSDDQVRAAVQYMVDQSQ
jgi:cytochrome c5